MSGAYSTYEEEERCKQDLVGRSGKTTTWKIKA
jgi:hypothetical protein